MLLLFTARGVTVQTIDSRPVGRSGGRRRAPGPRGRSRGRRMRRSRRRWRSGGRKGRLAVLPRSLGLRLQAALVKGEGLLALQLQALRGHGLVAGLTGTVMSPAKLDAPAEPLHHRAVLRHHELRHGARGQNHEPRAEKREHREQPALHSAIAGGEGHRALRSPILPLLLPSPLPFSGGGAPMPPDPTEPAFPMQAR